MTFACAHKGFTQAANHPTSGYIGRGNVYSDVQTSSYIRPHCDTDCNGMTFIPGRLQAHDLGTFSARIPAHVLGDVERYTQEHNAILYQFFHYAAGRKTEHGWILTDTDHALVCAYVTGPSWRSRSVIDACRAYLDIAERPAVAA